MALSWGGAARAVAGDVAGGLRKVGRRVSSTNRAAARNAPRVATRTATRPTSGVSSGAAGGNRMAAAQARASAAAAGVPAQHGPGVGIPMPRTSTRGTGPRWQAAQARQRTAAAGNAPMYGPAAGAHALPQSSSRLGATMGTMHGPPTPKKMMPKHKNWVRRHPALAMGGLGAAAGVGSLLRNTGPGATGNGYSGVGNSSGGRAY